MPFYRCLLRGENFAWKQSEGWQLMGFFTSRWVRAPNPQAAELKAMSTLLKEPAFHKPDGYPGGPPAAVFVEEIEQLRIPPLKRGSGATWFAMEGG